MLVAGVYLIGPIIGAAAHAPGRLPADLHHRELADHDQAGAVHRGRRSARTSCRRGRASACSACTRPWRWRSAAGCSFAVTPDRRAEGRPGRPRADNEAMRATGPVNPAAAASRPVAGRRRPGRAVRPPRWRVRCCARRSPAGRGGSCCSAPSRSRSGSASSCSPSRWRDCRSRWRCWSTAARGCPGPTRLTAARSSRSSAAWSWPFWWRCSCWRPGSPAGSARRTAAWRRGCWASDIRRPAGHPPRPGRGRLAGRHACATARAGGPPAYLLVKLPVTVGELYAAFFAAAGLANLTYPFWWPLFRNHPPGVRLGPV